MNKTQKSFVLAAGATALGFSALGGATAIHAATTNPTSTSPESTLVQMIAKKFNLNVTDVQAVANQEHQNQLAHQAAAMKTRLDADVAAGKITPAEETLIIAKQAEVKTFMQSLHAKSAADRKTAMATEETSLKTWATANSIPLQYIHFGGRGRPGGPNDGALPPTGSTTPQ